jgi:hypothetical protein
MRPLKIKIPSESISRQLCAERFDSGVKALSAEQRVKYFAWRKYFSE